MPSSAVLVPLYVYPFPGAWTPLYDAIEANPGTQFLVIINPGNGPGPTPLPDANYCREIPKLGSHSNVAIYGYVYVNWARRDLDHVRKDVEIYAAWPEQHRSDTLQPPQQGQDVSDARLAIDGIFVDETPILAHEHEVAFLGSLTSLVHSIWPNVLDAATSETPVSDSDSTTPARIPTIIHNPGCMPPPGLRELADLCVVFEDTHTTFLNRLKEGVFALPADEEVQLTDGGRGEGGVDGDGKITGQQTLGQEEGLSHSVGVDDVDCDDSWSANSRPTVAHGGEEAPGQTPGPARASEMLCHEIDAGTKPSSSSARLSAAAAAATTAGDEEGVLQQAEDGRPPAKTNNPWAAAAVAAEGGQGGVAQQGYPRRQTNAEKERLRRAVVVHSVSLPEPNKNPSSSPLLAGNQVDDLGEEGVDDDDDDDDDDDQSQERTENEQDKRRAADVRDLVAQAKQVAGALFVTELSSGFYEGFSRGWREWAGVIGAKE